MHTHVYIGDTVGKNELLFQVPLELRIKHNLNKEGGGEM